MDRRHRHASELQRFMRTGKFAANFVALYAGGEFQHEHREMYKRGVDDPVLMAAEVTGKYVYRCPTALYYNSSQVLDNLIRVDPASDSPAAINCTRTIAIECRRVSPHNI